MILSKLWTEEIGIQPQRTRSSSGDEIANVNFLTGDIVHALQNTIQGGPAKVRPTYIVDGNI